MKKSLFYLFVFLFVQFFTVMAVTSLWKLFSADASSIYVTVLSSAVYSVILLALFLWRHWAELSPAWLRTHRWDVLFWAAVAALGTYLPFEAMQELLPPLDDATAATLEALAKNELGYIVLCIFAPFVEEVVFRGAILRALLPAFRKPWAAIAISAVIFAVAHCNLTQMPHAFIAGLLLGWMYFRTGSILPGVAFHWANNTVSYAIVYLMPSAETLPLRQVFGSDLRVLMAMGCSLCILLPALYQLNRTMRRQQGVDN